MQQFMGSPESSESAQSTRSPNAGGPRKRARNWNTDESSHLDATDVNGRAESSVGTVRHRLRAAVACKTCRARKTKCDGRRPVCGYCEKTENSCQYDSLEHLTSQSPTTCQNIGHDVLHAVQHLTQIIKEQQRQRNGPYDSHLSRDDNRWSTSPGGQINVSSTGDSDTFASPMNDTTSSEYHSIAPEGLDSILRWKVFPQTLSTIPVDNGEIIPLSNALPSISLAYLKQLVDNYIVVVHTKNPMLDLLNLQHYVAQVAENGFDWSTRACLVAAVCAIGALCQERDSNLSSLRNLSSQDREDSAQRFWSVASKRLGLAMTYNTIESAQCLCLSGIWFMCCLQPLEAWKHFTMAGNAWYSCIIARTPTGNLDVQLQKQTLQTLEQSTFYTSYKSELEIRYELGMHGSVLGQIEDRIVFPIPPLSQDSIEADLSPTEGSVSWYFYLSDIAARHLINRIVESRSKIGVVHSGNKIQALIRDYEVFRSQLNEWYESLAPAVKFDLPETTLSHDPNLATHILRSRYLFIHELLCRPFLSICLNQSLALPEGLIDHVASLASLGLKHCAWKLQSSYQIVRLDHGLWILVRNTTACSMMLIGAARAKRMPNLNAALRLQIPEGWRESILTALTRLGPIANETRGGVAFCVDLIHQGLSDFPESA